MPVTTVLLDLDGVIRHFDPDHLVSVELQHDLAPGSLMAAAFHPDRLLPAITGGVRRSEWVRQIGEAVNNHAAVEAWMADRGALDAEILDLVTRLREAGFIVAVLTNGTDTVPEEIEQFGLSNHFDAVFSTWTIGFAKPDERAFAHVCDALDVEPGAVFFTDDSASKLGGATNLGMYTRHFTGVADLRDHLIALGVTG